MFEKTVFDNSHAYRTEIPNIIEALGLDPYEYRVYGYLKKVAGDGGVCFQSVNKMAEHLKIEEKTLRRCKISLSTPRQELGGKALIVIQSRPKIDGVNQPDLIYIEDIWPENYAVLSKLKKSLGGVNSTPGVGEMAPQGGGNSPGKEEPIKNNPIRTTATPLPPVGVAAVFSCLLNLEMPSSDKEYITKSFPEPIVERSVAWATHPTTTITKSLAAAIKWACENKPELPKSKDEKAQENKVYAKQKENSYKTTSGSIIKLEALEAYVHIYPNLGNTEGVEISYCLAHDEFKRQIITALEKYGLNIMKKQ